MTPSDVASLVAEAREYLKALDYNKPFSVSFHLTSQLADALEESERERDKFREALEKLRAFLQTQPMMVFGEGTNDRGMFWPLRDEVINDITLTLDRQAIKPEEKGGE